MIFGARYAVGRYGRIGTRVALSESGEHTQLQFDDGERLWVLTLLLVPARNAAHKPRCRVRRDGWKPKRVRDPASGETYTV